MEIVKEISEKLAQKDKYIIESHLKKDREALKRTLNELNEERLQLRRLFHRLEEILEKQEMQDMATSQDEGMGQGEALQEEKQLGEIEDRFSKIWSKKEGERTDEEREYIKKQFPKLMTTEARVRKRLHKLDEIIAKTTILLDDLNEDLCRSLTGRSLATVAQALEEHFGPHLREDHGKGRRTIRNFIEQHYRLDKNASRLLFSLLEDVGILHFHLEFPEGDKRELAGFFSGSSTGISQPYIPPELKGVWDIRA